MSDITIILSAMIVLDGEQPTVVYSYGGNVLTEDHEVLQQSDAKTIANQIRDTLMEIRENLPPTRSLSSMKLEEYPCSSRHIVYYTKPLTGDTERKFYLDRFGKSTLALLRLMNELALALTLALPTANNQTVNLAS